MVIRPSVVLYHITDVGEGRAHCEHRSLSDNCLVTSELEFVRQVQHLGLTNDPETRSIAQDKDILFDIDEKHQILKFF